MRAPHFLLAALVAFATFFGLRAAAWHRWQHRAAWQAGQPGYKPGRLGQTTGSCRGPGTGRVLPPTGR